MRFGFRTLHPGSPPALLGCALRSQFKLNWHPGAQERMQERPTVENNAQLAQVFSEPPGLFELGLTDD